MIVVMDRGSNGCGSVAAMEVSSFSFSFFSSSSFCVVLLGSNGYGGPMAVVLLFLWVLI